MIDGEIELKNKIFIVKKGTIVGKKNVNYYIENCLFILNISKGMEIEHKENEIRITKDRDLPYSICFEAGNFNVESADFQAVVWTDFKKRWKLIKEAQEKGMELCYLFDEITEEKEDEAATINKLVSKGW